jgi:hypothetical protein
MEMYNSGMCLVSAEQIAAQPTSKNNEDEGVSVPTAAAS